MRSPATLVASTVETLAEGLRQRLAAGREEQARPEVRSLILREYSWARAWTLRTGVGRTLTPDATNRAPRIEFGTEKGLPALQLSCSGSTDAVVNDTSYKLVLFVVVGLAGVAAFIVGRRQARNGFLLFIATLGLGFRTLPLTHDFRIHPAEIALAIVLLCVFAKRPEKFARRKDGGLPWWLWAMMPLMVLAWLPRPDNWSPWDQQLAECVNISRLAIPASWLPVPCWRTATRGGLWS